MNNERISADDPRLTAYALGELAGDERAVVEAAVRHDPAARAAVAEIRALASRLESALATEVTTPVAAANRTGSMASAHSSGLNKSQRQRRRPAVFWTLWSIGSGLVAACLVLAFVWRIPSAPQPPAPATEPAPKVKTADEGPPVVQPGPSSASSSAPAPGRAASVADGSAATFPSGILAQARLLEAGRKARNEAPTIVFPPPPATVGGAAVPAFGGAVGAAWDFGDGNRTHPGMARGVLGGSNGGGRSDDNTPGAHSYGASLPLSARVVQKSLDHARIHMASLSGTTLAAREQESEQWTQPFPPRSRDSEAYAYRADNEFTRVADHPLSTFSADVDTASYANVRRFLHDSRLPPVDAVRIEELVNYFPYRYAPPAGDTPFAATLEVAGAPWAPQHRLVRIGSKAREVAKAARGPANLVFLLDVSGSMRPANKLPLVQESMRLLLGRLRADDRVAIVTYAGASGLALPSTRVAKAREIAAAIDELTPGGSTNGAMGLQLAYDIAKANFVPDGINRVILCTDGDFNVGVTSEGELVRLVEEKAKSGVFLTVLGFGMGNLKDAMLQQIADRGNGSYGYVDTRREAEKLLVEQVSGTLMTVAKDVKLQVEFNPAKVARYRLIGYEKRLLAKEDFNNDRVDAGEIGAGHTVTALYEIIPAGAEDAAIEPQVDDRRYTYFSASPSAVRQKTPAAHADELLTLKVRYKQPSALLSTKLEFPLTDAGASFAEASEDFRFAGAVAAFGMILRDSPHKGAATLDDVVAWAEAATSSDPGGYRAEFVELAKQARQLTQP